MVAAMYIIVFAGEGHKMVRNWMIKRVCICRFGMAHCIVTICGKLNADRRLQWTGEGKRNSEAYANAKMVASGLVGQGRWETSIFLLRQRSFGTW